MAWLFRVMRPWAIPILKAYLKTKTLEGLEHIPKQGAAILASNHLSALDHLILPAMTKRVVYNISKKEHFEHKVRGWAFKHWGVLSLDRGKGDTSAIEKAKEIILDGNLFCIYPEGTRSRDGKLHKGHTGVARLALETGAPVIPIGMLGTYEKKPAAQKGMAKGVITGGRAGPALTWPTLVGQHANRDVCRQVTDEIMAAIQKVSGQDYVDEYTFNAAYAAKMKDSVATNSEK
jgi:1-acyl-sn-glycerol-3-phosphate acyltransferase